MKVLFSRFYQTLMNSLNWLKKLLKKWNFSFLSSLLLSWKYRQHKINWSNLFFKNEELLPSVDEVGLHAAAHRSEVVLSGDAAVDGEWLVVEEPLLQQVLHLCAVEVRLFRPDKMFLFILKSSVALLLLKIDNYLDFKTFSFTICFLRKWILH